MRMKRFLDMMSAGLGLLLLSPLLAILALLVRVGSPGPALFRQERMGRKFRPFQILKFRTMVQDAPQRGGPITFGADPRITPLGNVLRKTKLDELPQLINVLKGDMSLVGPRPEVPRYVEMFRADYAEILRVRPGITDLASIQYRDEAAVLGAAANPEEEYVRRVLPEKIRLAKEYVERRSLRLDLAIIFGTLFRLVCDRAPRWQDDSARTELHQQRR
jgi:lipopolysaccharide/colanic/teichoic acid biosynthesis glycosyltransferase